MESENRFKSPTLSLINSRLSLQRSQCWKCSGWLAFFLSRQPPVNSKFVNSGTIKTFIFICMLFAMWINSAPLNQQYNQDAFSIQLLWKALSKTKSGLKIFPRCFTAKNTLLQSNTSCRVCRKTLSPLPSFWKFIFPSSVLKDRPIQPHYGHWVIFGGCCPWFWLYCKFDEDCWILLKH